MTRTFTVDLLALGERFERWCASRGKTRSVAIRELVGQALAVENRAVTNPFSTTDAHPIEEEPQEERETPRTRRFTLRLREEELAQLRKQSAAAGLPAARYLACLSAAAERGEASVAGKGAVEALIESNHHLAWIGRNLSLAARDNGGTQETAVDLGNAEVHETLEALRRHLANAAGVLANIEDSRGRVRHGARRLGRAGRQKRRTKTG